MRTLVAQAVDRRGRYTPVCYQQLNIGDIILLKEPNTKTINFPLGIIKEIEVNDLGETVGAVILKGRTQVLVKRHVTTLIPYLRKSETRADVSENHLDKADSELTGTQIEAGDTSLPDLQNEGKNTKVPRKAAIASRNLTKMMLS